MSFSVMRADEHEWEERPFAEGAPPRRVERRDERRCADAVARADRGATRRARAAAATRSGVQEEVFVVLQGTLTMLLGDPPERHDLPPQSVVAVPAGTVLQMRNESDEEVVVFVYGAPPVAGQAEHLDDVEL